MSWLAPSFPELPALPPECPWLLTGEGLVVAKVTDAVLGGCSVVLRDVALATGSFASTSQPNSSQQNQDNSSFTEQKRNNVEKGT